MRIHEGDYAYEVFPTRDPLTQLAGNWKYQIFRLRPVEERLASGEEASKEKAEQKAREKLRQVLHDAA